MIDISMLSSRYRVRRLDDSDAPAILDFCRRNALYYQYCGAEPTLEQVLSDLHIAPPGIGQSDKYYVGFFDGDTMAAVLDLVDGYPEPDVCYIGFFMMNADLQGRRIGSGIIGEVCAYLKGKGCAAVRLAIARDNPQANHFWRKNGFNVVGEVPQEGWTALVAERAL